MLLPFTSKRFFVLHIFKSLYLSIVHCFVFNNILSAHNLKYKLGTYLVFQDGAHCACFHPDGNILVVGTCSARWLVIDVNTRDIISTHTDGNEQLECIMFAPGL